MTDFKTIALALDAHLSEKYSTVTVTDDTWWVVVGNLMVKAVSVALPWIRAIIDTLDEEHATRSITLPIPGGEGALIVYSTAAISDGLQYCVTATHEHEHARVLKTQPDLEVVVDYACAELRAASEARAFSCGAFTRYLLTGQFETADEIVSPLNHGYMLSQGDVAFARSMVMSDLASMRNGAVPPHELCQVVLAFLVTNFPDAIRPLAFQVHGP